jgi:hypothetical protein
VLKGHVTKLNTRNVGDPDPDPTPSLLSLKVLCGMKKCLQSKIVTQNFSKKICKAEDNVPMGEL